MKIVQVQLVKETDRGVVRPTGRFITDLEESVIEEAILKKYEVTEVGQLNYLGLVVESIEITEYEQDLMEL